MPLKQPCQHGRYDEHYLNYHHEEPDYCPGGSLLPPDSLVIVKEECEWPGWAIEGAASAFDNSQSIARRFAKAALDALAAAQPGTTDG